MTMSSNNLSPNFEDRFAKIDLRNPRLASKFAQHHPPTTPNSLTKPKLAILSTAARAETRLISSRSVSVNNLYGALHGAKTPNRIINSAAFATTKKSRRHVSASESRLDAKNTSYMKETSSSMKKVRNPFHDAATPASMPKSRRVLSSRPSDITNYDLPKARSRSPVSPAKRHVSQPSTKSAKLDVYTRLYNDSKNRHPNRSLRQTSRTLEPDRHFAKVQNLSQLLQILYDEDPGMFDGIEDNTKYVCNVQQDVQSLHPRMPNNDLAAYERGELASCKNVYYLPPAFSQRHINIRNYSNNYGFDDKSGNYVVLPHDHINYRYEVQSVLGNGSFGNVIKCIDRKFRDTNTGNDKVVAIKIIKNDLNWSLQAVYEIKMLKHLNKAKDDPNKDPYDNQQCPVLKYFDHFHFRGHMCIVTEPLSVNLYTMLEMIKFQGLSLSLLRAFSRQILHGLEYIHSNNTLHCDIKPENIMIRVPPNYTRSANVDESALTLKIVDFGSSCFKNEIAFSYIQSRFYRAPEVILGAKYDKMIDIWSAGCVLTELFTGDPLLPGKNELEQIAIIVELFGAPPSSLIIQQRNQLIKSMREEQTSTKFALDPADPTRAVRGLRGKAADETTIKRTLLYTLFDLEGKLNMQFLNMRIQAAGNNALPGTVARKYYKIGSKSLETRLRSRASNENNIHEFIRFLERIFRWEPHQRATASQLLEDPFIGH